VGLDYKILLPGGLYEPNAKPITINFQRKINMYDDFALKLIFPIFWVVLNFSDRERKARKDRQRPVKAEDEN